MLRGMIDGRTALVMVVIMTTGCGEASRQDLDLVQSSVTSALDTWKSGEAAALLMSRSPPIEFHDDDWQYGAQLVDYELRKTYRDTDGAPRCAVRLTVRRRGAKPEAIEVTYQMNATSQIVIARDPYS